MSLKSRRKEINQYLDSREARILEIGALDDPTYTRPDYCIKYLDFTSTEMLATKNIASWISHIV